MLGVLTNMSETVIFNRAQLREEEIHILRGIAKTMLHVAARSGQLPEENV